MRAEENLARVLEIEAKSNDVLLELHERRMYRRNLERIESEQDVLLKVLKA